MPDAANFRYDHPRGPIYGWFSERGLRWLQLPTADNLAPRPPLLHSSVNDVRVWDLHAALDRYFAGIRQDFAGVPLDLEQGTPFQRSVWLAARDTPWGASSTYGALAHRLNNPGAARAVGQALGANPVPILVPCHRFLASDGRLGGFSCGLAWKQLLLKTENIPLRHPEPDDK